MDSKNKKPYRNEAKSKKSISLVRDGKTLVPIFMTLLLIAECNSMLMCNLF